MQVLLKLWHLAGCRAALLNVQLSLHFFFYWDVVLLIHCFNFEGLGGQFKIIKNKKMAWDKLPPTNTSALLGDNASSLLWKVFFQIEASYLGCFVPSFNIIKKKILVCPTAMSSLHVRARTVRTSALSSACLGLHPAACNSFRGRETRDQELPCTQSSLTGALWGRKK